MNDFVNISDDKKQSVSTAAVDNASVFMLDKRSQAIIQKKQSATREQSSTFPIQHVADISRSYFKDNRPQAIAQRNQANALAEKSYTVVAQRKANNTGLPDNLKSGIENLSGHSMDDVKVHYNSPAPAQLNAHAYAQGTDIHIASGQEKHLPHEAWHVVQQKQGRVRPTMQLKDKVSVNDDTGLEHEADVMGGKALQAIDKSRALNLKSLSASAIYTSPVQRVVKDAEVNWGVTHIVELKDESLFGEGDALMNELKPGNGGQLKKGDKLIIDDAPVVVSRRGSNQEHGGKRAEDKKGNHVYEWVRVLKRILPDGLVLDLSGSNMYVRKETITIVQQEKEEKKGGKNEISLHNILDWEGEKIPEQLTAIAKKWEDHGKLRRTKSKGVLDIDKNDMKKEKEGGLEKPSGRNWDQFDEGIEVATNMAKEDHEPFEVEKGQWRIKAINQETGELVGVLIVEDQDPLYLRWLIGNPEIKGGGSALLAAVKKLMLSEKKDVEVTSAYSAKDAYIRSGFKEKKEEEDEHEEEKDEKKRVLPGEEFTLSLRREDMNPGEIPKEHEHFKPEKYK